jgi:hypothetical protein
MLGHGVSPHLALETATKFAAQVSEPILAKIEPYDLGSFALDSNLAAEYCRRICRPEDPLKKTQRNVDYRGLVENYPTHEFIIDPAEASALGFQVSARDSELEEAFAAFRDLEVHACIGLVSIEDGDAP